MKQMQQMKQMKQMEQQNDDTFGIKNLEPKDIVFIDDYITGNVIVDNAINKMVYCFNDGKLESMSVENSDYERK